MSYEDNLLILTMWLTSMRWQWQCSVEGGILEFHADCTVQCKVYAFEMVELGEFNGCLIAQQGWNFVRSVDQSDRPRRLQSCNLFSYSSLSPRVSRALAWHWSVVTGLFVRRECLCHGQILMDPNLKSHLTWMETRHVASSRCISQSWGDG